MTLNNAIDQILQLEYDKLKGKTTNYAKSQFLYSIIQIKCDNKEFESHSRALYIDIKKFIRSYIDSVHSKSYGYDFVDINKIFKIYSFLRIKEAIAINKYLIRTLKARGYDEELEECRKEENRLRVFECKEHSKIKYIIKLTMFYSSKNIATLLISAIAILALYALILLPAPKGFPLLFKVQYDFYSNHFVLNHTLNLISGSLELTDNFKIIPLNVCGVLLLILGKLLLVILIGNYLIQNIIKEITE